MDCIPIELIGGLYIWGSISDDIWDLKWGYISEDIRELRGCA